MKIISNPKKSTRNPHEIPANHVKNTPNKSSHRNLQEPAEPKMYVVVSGTLETLGDSVIGLVRKKMGTSTRFHQEKWGLRH